MGMDMRHYSLRGNTMFRLIVKELGLLFRLRL
jgi:hypothetical protein